MSEQIKTVSRYADLNPDKSFFVIPLEYWRKKLIRSLFDYSYSNMNTS